MIRTVGSYLTGNLVFIAMDGLVRDASEIHKKAVNNEMVLRSADLVLRSLKTCNPTHVHFYLDTPISKSGELAQFLEEAMDRVNVTGTAETVHSPDYHLKQAKEGLICTSDSHIVDACQLPVFDLAYYTLQLHYKPRLLQMIDYI